MFSFRGNRHAGGYFTVARIRWLQFALMLFAGSLLLISASAEQRRDSDLYGDRTPRAELPPRSLPPQKGSPVDLEPETAPAPTANYSKFMDALSRWLSVSRTPFEFQKNSQELLSTMNKTAKEAASSVVTIPVARLITGRQLCPTASNGAPDCLKGANALCRANGFESGRSVDVTSTQRCPSRVWISGYSPREGDCRMDTFVIQAMCH